VRLGPRRRRREDAQAAAHDDPPAADAATDALAVPSVPPGAKRRPLYHRVLRLRHIAPTAWQRAAFADAPFALAVVLVLADVASAWTLVVLPLAVAVVVKAHDLLAGALAGPVPPPPVQDGSRE
jgi:hypothetical protein